MNARVSSLDLNLSALVVRGSSRPSSVKRSLSSVASFAANVRAMYLASIDDRATVRCLSEHQLIGLPFNMKIYLETEFLLSLSPAPVRVRETSNDGPPPVHNAPVF